MALGSFSGEVGFCQEDRATAVDTCNSFSCFLWARPCHPNLCSCGVTCFTPHSGGSVVTPAPRPAPRRVSTCSGRPACRTELAVESGPVRIPRARDRGRIHLGQIPRGQAARSWKSSNCPCLGNVGQGRPRRHVGPVCRVCGSEFVSSSSEADACAPRSRPC